MIEGKEQLSNTVLTGFIITKVQVLQLGKVAVLDTGGQRKNSDTCNVVVGELQSVQVAANITFKHLRHTTDMRIFQKALFKEQFLNGRRLVVEQIFRPNITL